MHETLVFYVHPKKKAEKKTFFNVKRHDPPRCNFHIQVERSTPWRYITQIKLSYHNGESWKDCFSARE